MSTRLRSLFFFFHHYSQLLLSLKDPIFLELEKALHFFFYSLKDYMFNWHSLFLERLVDFLFPLGKILKYNSSFLFELWKF